MRIRIKQKIKSEKSASIEENMFFASLFKINSLSPVNCVPKMYL
jgi:hypothetical protein